MSDQQPRRLKRSSADRMLSGVCGGLGSYFSVDPLILRIAFAVSVFFGGLGIVLYLAMTVLVPVDDAPDGKPLISLDRSAAVGIVVAVAVLVIAIPLFGALFAWIGDPGILWFIALVVLLVAGVTAWRDRSRRGSSEPSKSPAVEPEDTKATAGEHATEIMPSSASPAPAFAERTTEAIAVPGSDEAPGRPPRPRSNLLTVLLVCGTALLSIAGFFAAALTVGFGLGALVAAMIAAGGLAVFALAFAAGSAGRWLIAPLVAMVLGAGAAEAADLDLEGGVGQQTQRPQSAASIPGNGYRLGAGHLAIDLRDIAWREGQRVPVRADAGVGFVEIVVPPRVCVVGEASARAGYVAFAGADDSGFDAFAGPSSAMGAVSRSASKREGGGATSRAGTGDRRPAGPPPTVEIDASVDFGAVQVRNDGSPVGAELDHRPGPLSEGSLEEMRRVNERACAG